ncbi:MAG: LysM domain-containing protein [Planctomycetota bacterium]
MSLVFNGNQALQTATQQPFAANNMAAQSLYPNSSRYNGIAILQHRQPDGREIAYLDRRFLPPPTSFADLTQHTIALGDRMDNIAFKYLGDPEQYWRIADANAAMQPEDLTAVVGDKIRITLPEGIPGAARA